jgi:hypothetical protein
MHATRLDILQRQAEAAGLPIETISLPDPTQSLWGDRCF